MVLFELFNFQFSSYNELIFFSMTFSVMALLVGCSWWSIFTPGGRDNPSKLAKFLGWFCYEFADAFFAAVLVLFFVTYLNDWEAYGKLLIIFAVFMTVPLYIHGARRISKKYEKEETCS